MRTRQGLLAGALFALSPLGLGGLSAIASDESMVLLPSEAVGGGIVTGPDGRLGVTVPAGTPADQGYAWKLPRPLAPGWWEAAVEFVARPKHSQRFQFILGTRLQGSLDVSELHLGGPKTGFHFRFWNASPVESLAVRPMGKLAEDIVAIGRVTLSSADGSEGETEPLVVEMAVEAGGEVRLPAGLPGGNWQLIPHPAIPSGAPSTGGVEVGAAGGGRFTMPQSSAMYFATAQGLQSLKWSPAALDGAVLRFWPAARPMIPLDEGGSVLPVAVEGAVTRVTLTLSGSRGGRPELPVLPGGARIAVVTSWDDGVIVPDLRAAGLLEKHGMKGTFFLTRNAYKNQDYLAELERRGMEVASHTVNHPYGRLISPEQWARECLQMRVKLESAVGHPVVSFAYPYNHHRADDVAGDYVLRGVREAGYLSARTTRVGAETFAGCAEPLLLRTDGHFKQHRATFDKAWERVEQGAPGGIFYFWGHNYEMQTEQDWADLEALFERYARRPNAWYATQGQVFLWKWIHDRARWENPVESAGAFQVTLVYPKLDPWLQRQVPVTVTVPEGVTGVVLGDGRALKIEDGMVKLPEDTL